LVSRSDTDHYSTPVEALLQVHGTHRWPTVIDVRRAAVIDDVGTTIAGAIACEATLIGRLAATLVPDSLVVCYDMHGHDASREATAHLRRFGLDARWLRGGFEAWRNASGLCLRKNDALQIPRFEPSCWVTRERPRIDRIACPWLIRRFIDPRARFLYVPAAEVAGVAAATGAIAFDMSDAPIRHHGDRCSFDALIDAFQLHDPALAALAVVVRGSDTHDPGLAAQSSGLSAVSSGLAILWPDDLAMLEAGMGLYDALLAWSRAKEVPNPGGLRERPLAQADRDH
jgi:rhodanese-related sulfurtransferase